MVEIQLTYRPALWPWKKTFNKQFPTEYNELSQDQFIAIACMDAATADDISFLNTMTGLPKPIIRKLGEFQQYKLFEIFNSYGANKPHNAFIIKKLSPCQGGRAKRRGSVAYFLPAPKLRGMTFGQSIFAGSLHEMWENTGSFADLCRFVASITLATNEVFSEDNIEEKAKLFENISQNKLKAIALNWRLIGEWLGVAYPLVFSKAEPGERVKKTNNGWLKIFDSIVGPDIVNADRYATLPVNNVFRYMSERIKENMKRKK